MGFPDENFCSNAPFNQKDKKVKVFACVEMHKPIDITLPEESDETDLYGVRATPELEELVKKLQEDGWEVDDYFIDEC